MNKREFIRLERNIKKEFECPSAPYPIVGDTKPYSKVIIKMGGKKIMREANKDGEWIIDLTDFWFEHKLDYKEFSGFTIEVFKSINLKEGRMKI